MIKLNVNSTRNFTIDKNEEVYEGEKNISQLAVNLPDQLKDSKISEYACELRAYISDEDFVSYQIDTSERTSVVDIGLDLTDEARTVKLLFVFTKDGEIVGKTNVKELTVKETLAGAEVETRAEIEAELENMEALEQQMEHFERELVNLIQGTTQELDFPSEVTKVGAHAFKEHSELTRVVINEGCTEIGESAFSYCANLANITIPESVTTIGENAFSYCANLANITIPESVTAIGRNAFSYCANLANITIPAGVTTIDRDAFYSCINLTDIYYTGTQAQWESIAGLSSASIPAGCTIHYEYTPAESESE